MRSIDLFATLAELAAGLIPPSDGTSLMPVLRGEDTADRDVFAAGHYGHSSYLRAAIVGPWKLLQDVRAGTEQLYRLDEDPRELDNRIGRDPGEAERLRQLLGRRWDLSANDVVLLRKFDRLGRFPDRIAFDWFFIDYMMNQCKEGLHIACVGIQRLGPRFKR